MTMELFDRMKAVGWVHPWEVVDRPSCRDLDLLRNLFRGLDYHTVEYEIPEEPNRPHEAMRAVLDAGWSPSSRWTWYYCGDTFIVAFHAPADAVSFKLMYELNE